MTGKTCHTKVNPWTLCLWLQKCAYLHDILDILFRERMFHTTFFFHFSCLFGLLFQSNEENKQRFDCAILLTEECIFFQRLIPVSA